MRQRNCPTPFFLLQIENRADASEWASARLELNGDTNMNNVTQNDKRSNRRKSTVRDDALTLIKALTGRDNVLVIPTEFVRYTGSSDAALFLNQVLYWTDRATMPNGWFWKTYEDWKREIFLSEYQVRKAARLLVAKGVLETKLKKANGNPTVHYRLVVEKFSESFLEHLNNRDSALELLKNETATDSRIESVETEGTITEITSEISSEKTPEITRNTRPRRKTDDAGEKGDGIGDSYFESVRDTGRGDTVTDEAESVVALNAFESVGVTQYDVSMRDERTGEGTEYRIHYPQGLRDMLPYYLSANTTRSESFIVRPRGASLIQIDDLKEADLARIERYSFLTVETSAGNYQAWVALDGADETARRAIRERLVKKLGGDIGANGAMRMCGSVNRKPKRNGFRVRVRSVAPFKRTTASELEEAGLLLPVAKPAVSPSAPLSKGQAQKFPSYERCLTDKDGDRSAADASFLAISVKRGFSMSEAIAELKKVSPRVREEKMRGRLAEYLRLTESYVRKIA